MLSVSAQNTEHTIFYFLDGNIGLKLTYDDGHGTLVLLWEQRGIYPDLEIGRLFFCPALFAIVTRLVLTGLGNNAKSKKTWCKKNSGENRFLFQILVKNSIHPFPQETDKKSSQTYVGSLTPKR